MKISQKFKLKNNLIRAESHHHTLTHIRHNEYLCLTHIVHTTTPPKGVAHNLTEGKQALVTDVNACLAEIKQDKLNLWDITDTCGAPRGSGMGTAGTPPAPLSPSGSKSCR
jgi:hypothetical protein